jgi:hypothetical protein
MGRERLRLPQRLDAILGRRSKEPRLSEAFAHQFKQFGLVFNYENLLTHKSLHLSHIWMEHHQTA